jgi:hypothetical protein
MSGGDESDDTDFIDAEESDAELADGRSQSLSMTAR